MALIRNTKVYNTLKRYGVLDGKSVHDLTPHQKRRLKHRIRKAVGKKPLSKSELYVYWPGD